MSCQTGYRRFSIRSRYGYDFRPVLFFPFKVFQCLGEHFDFTPDRNAMFIGKRQNFLQLNIRTQTRTDRNDIENRQSFGCERTAPEPDLWKFRLQSLQSVRIITCIGNTNTRPAISTPACHRQTGFTQSQYEYFLTCPVHII